MLGRESTLRLLLDRGADVRIKSEQEQIPLHCAARAGNKAIAEMLLKADEAGLNAMDVHGQTPLAMAAYAGDKGTVQLLLDYSADKLIDKYGRLPGLAIPNLTTVVVPLVDTLYGSVVYDFATDDAVMTILQTLRPAG
ncbi:hypothetical protein CCMA1212_007112 [Trichoderma ghanense]|uniref:Ankyrin repeat protein n=1 Tax=Trichoderma ghanense TaxID=65468 RepID=A0ABY2GXJ1_9HYPO